MLVVGLCHRFVLFVVGGLIVLFCNSFIWLLFCVGWCYILVFVVWCAVSGWWLILFVWCLGVVGCGVGCIGLGLGLCFGFIVRVDCY